MSNPEQSEAFIQVIERHKGIIYKIANSYCRDDEDKKDLVQEIIYQLWKSFENYNSQYKHSTWIFRIALNVSISFYRKENKRKEITNPLSKDIFHLTEEDTKEKQGNLQLLQQFIYELKELDKALMLLYLEEKSHKEIAEIIGISESNVSTKINRIKNVLKEKFTSKKI